MVLRAMAEDFTLSGFEQIRGVRGEGVSKDRQKRSDLPLKLITSASVRRTGREAKSECGDTI